MKGDFPFWTFMLFPVCHVCVRKLQNITWLLREAERRQSGSVCYFQRRALRMTVYCQISSSLITKNTILSFKLFQYLNAYKPRKPDVNEIDANSLHGVNAAAPDLGYEDEETEIVSMMVYQNNTLILKSPYHFNVEMKCYLILIFIIYSSKFYSNFHLGYKIHSVSELSSLGRK